MERNFIGVGRSIEGTRGSLQRLTQQVKAADEIFTKTARRGEVFGVRALAEYTMAHNRVNEVFSKTASSWTHGFAAVQSHAQGAGRQLLSFASEIGHFQHTRTELVADYNKALERQVRMQDFMTQAQTAGNLKLSEAYAFRAAEAGRMAVIGKYELALLEVRKASIPLMVIWGETVGRVLEQSFELQRNFRDVNLDFAGSVDLTKTLLSSMGSSRGLVNIKEAAETFGTLRSYSLDFLKPEVIGRLATFGELTGVSTQSVAKILYQLKSLGGEMPNVNRLTNSFTYFARETDLGAGGVSELLGKMDPLITSYPKELRETLITEVLALGDAFKRAGLNVDDVLKTIQDMQDLTSQEGPLKAAMIASKNPGVNPMELMMGNMDPSRIGFLWTKAQRDYMRQLTQGGKLPSRTAASILSKQFGGSLEEWIKAGGMTDKQVSDLQARMEEDKKRGEQIDNFSKALDALTSGPIAALSTLFNRFNAAALEAGTNILQMMIGWSKWVDEKFPGLHQSLAWFFTWMTDDKKSGFRWAVNSITKVIMILSPVLGVKLVKGLWDLWWAGGRMITTFRKMAEVIDNVNAAAVKYTLGQEKLAAEEVEAAAMAGKAEAKVATTAAKGGIGGAEIAVGGAMAGGGIFGWLGKLFGKGEGKAEAEIGTGLLEKLGLKGLLSLGGKAAGKLAKGIPVIGGIVGMIMAIKDIMDLWNDPKEHNPIGFFKMFLKLVGGIATFIPGWGLGISLALDGLVAALGDNTDANKDNAKAQEDANKKASAAATPAPVSVGTGQGLTTGTGDIYTDMTKHQAPFKGAVRTMSEWAPGEKLTHATAFGALQVGGKAVRLGLGDIAMSVALMKQMGLKLGDYVDILDKNGNVLYAHQRIADTSWYNNPVRDTHGIELWGRKDIGWSRVVPSGTKAGGPAATTTGAQVTPVTPNGVSTAATGKNAGTNTVSTTVTAEKGASATVNGKTITSTATRPTTITVPPGGVSASVYWGGNLIKRPALPPSLHWSQGGGDPNDNIVVDSQGRSVGESKLQEIFSDYYSTHKTSMLNNDAVQDHLESEIQRNSRRGRVALRSNLPENRQAVFTPVAETGERTADAHGKAMLAELQASNRMSKERMHYLRESRFLGPTLLPTAAEDTLANV
jgi:hypothetical protein